MELGLGGDDHLEHRPLGVQLEPVRREGHDEAPQPRLLAARAELDAAGDEGCALQQAPGLDLVADRQLREVVEALELGFIGDHDRVHRSLGDHLESVGREGEEIPAQGRLVVRDLGLDGDAAARRAGSAPGRPAPLGPTSGGGHGGACRRRPAGHELGAGRVDEPLGAARIPAAHHLDPRCFTLGHPAGQLIEPRRGVGELDRPPAVQAEMPRRRDPAHGAGHHHGDLVPASQTTDLAPHRRRLCRQCQHREGEREDRRQADAQPRSVHAILQLRWSP